MKYTTVPQPINLLPSFTYRSYFIPISLSHSYLSPIPVPPVLLYFHFSSVSNCTYLQFHSHVGISKLICHFCVPDCRLQPLVQGSLLYQAECLGKDLQSNSGRVAHPHQSNKHTSR